MKVTALPVDPGPAAWNEILPAGRRFAPLSGKRTVQVAVIGAGFAGLTAAQRLIDSGVQGVVVLEAKDIAEGPAGRNSGFMLDLPHELNSDSYTSDGGASATEIRLNRLAIAYASELAQRNHWDRETFNPCGRVTAAASAKGIAHVRDYQSELTRSGESFETLDAAQLKAMTGSDFYQEGLYTAGAAMIQPASFIRGLADSVSDQAVIFEQSPVVALDPMGSGWRVATPGGENHAEQVILAVNGHIQSFGQYPKQLLHVFTYASMTRALSATEMKRLGGHEHWGILPADPMGTTVRRHGHRLIIRNHATLNQNIQTTDSDMKRAAMLQDRSFANRFPTLGDVEFEYRWGGRLCLSLNSGHAFGEIQPGLVSACCQNGLGTVKGMLSGMLAADLVTGGADQGDVKTLIGLNHLKRLPPDPFLTLGARATMRFKEWRAGIEL